ncbi:phosphate ABC transporter substrate-binding protein PstS, partial [Neisseria dentiae]
MKIRILAVAAATALILTACGGGDSTPPQAKQQNAAANTENAVLNITGAGASFPQPVYVQWAQAFQAATGGKVNYQSIGSSGGVKQISAKTVQFGASDSPLKAEELEKQGLVQFPTVIGGVVPVVNVDGIVAGDLKLTGEVLAGIYLGDIKKWNDPKIKALNPSLVLPDAPITTVFRSDGSGTSFIFTTYLSQVSPKWKDTVGAANTVKWPTSDSGTAGKGNEGVSTYVNRVKNSIGYVEYAYAKQNNMAHVQMQN